LVAPEITRLSEASKLYLWMPQDEIEDWFFIEEGNFIRLYGFFGAPLLLLVHVIDWVFSMEYGRKIDYIDVKYGTVAKKRLIYTLPHKVHDFVLQSRGGGNRLKDKFLGLKLKKIN